MSWNRREYSPLQLVGNEGRMLGLYAEMAVVRERHGIRYDISRVPWRLLGIGGDK